MQLINNNISLIKQNTQVASDLNNQRRSSLNLTIPTLPTSTDSTGILQDVQELTGILQDQAAKGYTIAKNLWSWVIEDESTTPRVDTNKAKKTELMTLQNQLFTLQAEGSSLEKKLIAIQEEMKKKLTNFNPEEEHETAEVYTHRAEAIINQQYVKYLTNNLSQLENLEKQAHCLDALSGTSSDLTALHQQIADIQETIKTVKSTLSIENEAFADWDSFKSDLIKAFEAICLDDNNEQEPKFQTLVTKLQSPEGQLDDSDFTLLQEALNNKDILDLTKANISQILSELVTKHPHITRLICSTSITALGLYLGGPVAAFFAKFMADKMLKDFIPQSAPESTTERVLVGTIETAVAAATSGPLGALMTAGANGAEAAPEPIQVAIAGAAGAITAQGLGAPISVAAGLGLGSMLVFKNPILIKTISRDMAHAWSICRNENLFSITKKFSGFLVSQVTTNVMSVTKTFRRSDEKKTSRTETIYRVASLTIGGAMVGFNFWSMPLVISLFYLVNKSYQQKYTGLANFENPEFRHYVRQEVNESKDHKLEKLRTLLKDENVTSYDELFDLNTK